MEQLDYKPAVPLVRGLNMDDAIWDVTVFTYPAGPRAESALGRALHRRWNAAGSVGEFEKFSAKGFQERRSARRGRDRLTVGVDKAYDTADFVAECSNLKVTPHVAQNLE